MSNIKLTRRGRIVVWILIFAATIAFSHITRDICWTGSGYGSCKTFVNSVTEGGKK